MRAQCWTLERFRPSWGTGLQARRLLTVVLATAGVLCATAAPALAKEGLGVVGTFGGPGAAKLSLVPFGEGEEREGEPGSGVAVSSADDVYVADTNNDRVEWFNSTGSKVEGEFNGSGKLANEAGKQAPQPLSNPEAIAVDNDPASPSFEDVYVADTTQGVLDKFTATGEFIFQLKIKGVSAVAIDPSGDLWLREANHKQEEARVQEYSNAVKNVLVTSLEAPAKDGAVIAVDSEDNLYLNELTGEVGKFTDTGTPFGSLGDLCGGGSGSCGMTGLAVDPATNGLFVDRDSFMAQYGPFGEPFQVPVFVSKPNTLGSGAGLAVGPSNHEIYVADAATNDIVVFADGPGPEVPETLGTKELEPNSVILEGELSPHGETGEVKYHFLYSTEGTCTGAANAGIAPVPAATLAEASKALVHVEATHLVPLEEYTYCLAVENNFTEGDVGEVGPPKTFTTPAAAPEVVGESASSVNAEVREFAAAINPENQETTYSFEYSTEGKTGPGEALEGAIHTVPGGSPISGFSLEGLPAGVQVEELRVKATYYYRVVATNATGTTDGKVEAYTKLPLLENESVSARTSISATLEATVNPVFVNGTKYAFEYATEAAALGTSQATVVGKGKLPEAEVSEQFPVSVGIVSLRPDQTYYYRVVAENVVSEETTNANEGNPVDGPIESFKTYAGPAATTGEAQNITGTSATLSGAVNPGGAPTTYEFAYISEAGYLEAQEVGAANPYAAGATTESRRLSASETTQAVGPVQAIGLLPSTIYHYALIATNQFGIQSIGEDHTFTTGPSTPPVPPPNPITQTAGVPYLLTVPATTTLAFPANDLPKEEHTNSTGPTPLTNKQKLNKALKACRKDKKSKRQKCEHAARSKYKVPAKKGHAQK